MKRLLLFCLLASVAGLVTAQVESNVPGAYANRAAAAVNPPSEVVDAAAQAAAADPLIDSRVDATTGEVIYYQRRVCESSGQVYYQLLDYDMESESFVAAGWVAATGQNEQVDPDPENKPACSTQKTENAPEVQKNESNQRRTKRRRSSAVKLVSYHH